MLMKKREKEWLDKFKLGVKYYYNDYPEAIFTVTSSKPEYSEDTHNWVIDTDLSGYMIIYGKNCNNIDAKSLIYFCNENESKKEKKFSLKKFIKNLFHVS